MKTVNLVHGIWLREQKDKPLAYTVWMLLRGQLILSTLAALNDFLNLFLMIRYLLGISLLMLTACQKNETDPQLKRAFEIHEMALAVHDSLKTQLEALSTQTLTPEQQQTVAQIERSRKDQPTGD